MRHVVEQLADSTMNNVIVMCRLSVRQFVWKYWIDYWFVCGGCRIQFDRLSIVKHCCISDCTLCYVLSLTSNFVQAYMTQQHMILTTSTGTVVLVLVLGTEVLVLVLETWVLVLVLETQVLVLVLVLEWLSTGYNSDSQCPLCHHQWASQTRSPLVRLVHPRQQHSQCPLSSSVS